MSTATDQELIQLILAGDNRAFELLVEKHQDSVARFVWKIVPMPQDREEVCQDVFVKVFFKLDQFKGDASFTTWLYQVAYRTAISFHRKKKLDLVSMEEDPVIRANDPDPDEEIIRRMIGEQLDRLSLEERTIVTLYYMQDLTIEEIGRIVERPEGTVKSILHRVRQKLQARIERSTPDLVEAMI